MQDLEDGLGINGERLSWALRALGVDKTTATGKGVRIAVLDSGVDRRHPDFDGRMGDECQFVDDGLVDYSSAHGTHVAGAAAGARVPATPGMVRYGVAPEATIVSVRVFEGMGNTAPPERVVDAIRWAIREGISVIVFAGGAEGIEIDLEDLGDHAMKNKSLILTAAGDNGPDGDVMWPANQKNLLAVGAVKKDRTPWPMTARSPKEFFGGVNFAAPGAAVRTASPVSGENLTTEIDGTSVAAGLAAGVAALWVERHRYRGLDLWKALSESASNPAEKEWRDRIGKGVVQAPVG